MANQEWLTIAEACQALKVSRRTLYTYMESGHLRFYQVGGAGHRRIKAEDLELLMVPAASPNGHTAAGVYGQPGRNMVAKERPTILASLDRERLERQQRDQELQRLRPLQVWAGHPCALCREPLRGVVEPEVARELLKDLVHRDCLEEQEEGGSFPITFTFLEPRLIPAE